VLIIKSSGASGIGVHFRNFELAEGEEVYVYAPAADSIVFGPFTNNGPWGSGEFWSGTLPGDTAVIELHTPTGQSGKAFEVFEISHIFSEPSARLLSNEPDVLNCEVDASCYGDIEKNAVGRIVFNSNGGVYLCTGTLLNDRAQDLSPYFLTANHCVSTQAVAQTVEVYWFYQTTSCNSGVLRNWVHSPPGTYLLAAQSSNDFALLRLQNNAPGGVAFSGWDPNAQSIGNGVFGLHHPDAYVPPQIFSYLRRSTGSITSTNDSCFALVNAYRVDWTSGTTEPGSSGSGLWNLSHHLVGALSCGTGTCGGYSVYSKFANFYPQIRQYIDPSALSSPIANPATFVTKNSFRANWRSVSGATGYRLDVSTSSSFNTYVIGYHNLNVGNATSRTVTGLNASSRYYYRVRAYNGNGTSGNSNVVTVAALTNPTTGVALFEVYPIPMPTATPTAKLQKISSRSFVQTGQNVMMGGFSIQGTGAMRVIIRAIGPELTQRGITNVLANPTLELHDGTGALIATNNDWQTTILGGIITSNQVSDIQNSGHAPTAASESAIIANLPPGSYTATVRGVNNTTGVALLEVYDLSPDIASSLSSISTRGFVQTGQNVMIGGFVVRGTGAKRVIIRAIGPELAQHGVTNALANPTLELHDGTGGLLCSNDNWQHTVIGGIITSDQVAAIRASGHAPTDARESAIIADLPPGNYTAILRGVN
jgi:hypothetical protein